MHIVTKCLALALTLLFALPAALPAQDLFTALGGIPTPDIRVTAGDRAVILPVRRQGIIPRTVETVERGLGDWAYGYAADVPYFTFPVDTALTLHKGRTAQRVIRFFDADGELVYRLDNVPSEDLRQRCVNRRRGSYCVVEMSLADVPPVVLDDVAQVDITVRVFR